jgi:hypothetical protein
MHKVRARIKDERSASLLAGWNTISWSPSPRWQRRVPSAGSRDTLGAMRPHKSYELESGQHKTSIGLSEHGRAWAKRRPGSTVAVTMALRVSGTSLSSLTRSLSGPLAKTLFGSLVSESSQD